MKIILYTAITVNGFIAKEDDNTKWISQEEWDTFSAIAQKTGCIIVGHRTYNILTKQPEFNELEKIKVVAIAHQDFPTLATNHLVAKSSSEALSILNDFKEVIVVGGATINALFLKENLVDEIYVDIEPIIFNKGIPVFKNENFEKRLKLLGMKKLSEDEIQLHYQVIK